jgi:peptide/nickel transport system substrate-binding protein
MRSTPRSIRVALVVSMLGLAALALQSASAATFGTESVSTAGAAAHRCLVATGSGDPAFVRNFNPYVQGLPTSSFVRGGMYEPLVITSPAGGGKQYRWLAQELSWSRDGKTLTLTIRPNVKWSDGKPLTSADVVYSLTAGRQNATMDIVGLTRPDSNIASVGARGSRTVVIRLKTRDSQFIGATLNGQFVVPKHVFSKVADINKFLNTNPVGSGPFTRVSRFNTQDYVLEKNRNYWKRGAPRIQCLEYIRAASNDAALIQIVNGQADWTHNFVPNVEKAYIAKDRRHYHAFYSTTAYPIGLFFDLSKYPYSLVPFRKAVSRAIDRNKVSKLGEYGYAPPTDAIGIHGIFPTWKPAPTVQKAAKQLANYNPTAARKLLTDAGFTYKSGDLYDPHGNRVGFQIHVIAGWSDWVASLQIISKNLQDIGIDASVKLEPDWGSWFPFATSTKYVTLLWQTASAASPYGFFFSHLSRNAYVPPGEDGVNTGNYAHYWDPTATKLLNTWKNTLSLSGQKKIAAQLQALWLQKFPMIPLFIGPQWSTYSTKYFHCFPTPKNYYAQPIFNNFPDNTVTLTRICPGESAG